MIKYEQFERQAKKLMRQGAKVCPCCHHDHLRLNTDDDHYQYILECAMCGINVTHSLIMHIKDIWNHRALGDERINRITHNITCTWYDGETDEIRTITLDDKEKGENTNGTGSV